MRGNGVTTPVLTATLGSSPTANPTTTTQQPPTTQPPVSGTPSNLRVTGTTPSTVTIGWDGPAGASYQVLRSGIPIATVTATSFTDIGLFRATPYLYSVRSGGTTTPVLTATIP